jgi:hypothetical protein
MQNLILYLLLFLPSTLAEQQTSAPQNPITTMPLSGKLVSIVAIVALAALGWKCIFRTDDMVEWARRRYKQSSKFVQGYPFSNIVLKPWYPTYLRSMGIFIWLSDLLVVMVVFFPQKLPLAKGRCETQGSTP